MAQNGLTLEQRQISEVVEKCIKCIDSTPGLQANKYSKPGNTWRVQGIYCFKDPTGKVVDVGIAVEQTIAQRVWGNHLSKTNIEASQKRGSGL